MTEKLCVENDGRGRAVRVAKRAKGGRPCTGTGAAEEGAQQAYGGILLSPSGIPAAYSSSCSGEIL